MKSAFGGRRVLSGNAADALDVDKFNSMRVGPTESVGDTLGNAFQHGMT